MRVIDRIDRSFWVEVAKNCTHATFFHTPYWANLMTQSFAYQDISRGFIFENGTRAVFPLMRRRRALLKGGLSDYVSGPPYVYGGPIADAALTDGQFMEILEYINHACTGYDTVLIRGNPYIQYPAHDGYREVQDYSHVAELYKLKDEDDLFRSYSDSTRNYIRQAQEAGKLTVRESALLSNYETLYQIYQKTIVHWGVDRTHYPPTLFKNIHALQSDHIQLWAVYYNDILVGGDVNFCWNDYCCMFLSYHDRDYSQLQGRRYMTHAIALDGMAKGRRYYDFMQSGGVKGIEQFKKYMGGKVYPHTAWLKENPYLTKVKALKNKVSSLYHKQAHPA